MKKLSIVEAAVIVIILLIAFVTWQLPGKNHGIKPQKMIEVKAPTKESKVIKKPVNKTRQAQYRFKKNKTVLRKNVSLEDYDKNITNKDNIGYRYKDDDMFDLESLVGHINEYNTGYRDEFFSRKDYELLRDQLETSSGYPATNIVSQFENVIDYSLGIDFSEEKRVKIRNAQHEMLLKRGLIDGIFEQGEMSEELYYAKLKKLSEESLENVARMITDEEFEALYQMKKGDIHGSFSRIINLPLPEDEQILLNTNQ